MPIAKVAALSWVPSMFILDVWGLLSHHGCQHLRLRALRALKVTFPVPLTAHDAAWLCVAQPQCQLHDCPQHWSCRHLVVSNMLQRLRRNSSFSFHWVFVLRLRHLSMECRPGVKPQPSPQNHLYLSTFAYCLSPTHVRFGTFLVSVLPLVGWLAININRLWQSHLTNPSVMPRHACV